MGADPEELIGRVAGLPFWAGSPRISLVKGGMTNANFCVLDGRNKYFVRLGEDIPAHGVLRFNEFAASQAAAECGLSPPILYSAPGVLVFQWIEGKSLGANDLKDGGMIARTVALLKSCHDELPKYLRGPVLSFWVFQIIRSYIAQLRETGSRHADDLARFAMIADELEPVIGDIHMVFGHNDLLPANLIDDGQRLWLIDWDYAGFGSPLFDLANLATNASFNETEEDFLLSNYFGKKPDRILKQKFLAMAAASALRETLWSMVSEQLAMVDHDFSAYTAENRQRFEMAFLRYDFF
jgi:thiamine kinase-like enzyme